MTDAIAKKMQELLDEIGARFDHMADRARQAEERAVQLEADLRTAGARAVELQAEVDKLRRVTTAALRRPWGLA